jgi:hypothetical protein
VYVNYLACPLSKSAVRFDSITSLPTLCLPAALQDMQLNAVRRLARRSPNVSTLAALVVDARRSTRRPFMDEVRHQAGRDRHTLSARHYGRCCDNHPAIVPSGPTQLLLPPPIRRDVVVVALLPRRRVLLEWSDGHWR